MNRKRLLIIAGAVAGLIVVAVLALGLIGARVGAVYSGVTANYAPGANFAQEESFGGEGFPAAEPAPLGTQAASRFDADDAAVGLAAQAPVQERLIIRTANLSLIVEDTQASIEQIGGMANAMGGFVVNSNTYQAGAGALAGDITVRVPSERFDEAIDQMHSLAVEVSSEYIGGQDVTEEYVDLQARLDSLKTAEQRLLDIMANAQNTSDLLAAEAQLTIRQAEIESIQGRLQYLEQSAALSSISVNLMPSVLSQPVDVGWKPLETIRRAVDALAGGFTGIVDAAIFVVIAVLPTLLLIGLLVAPFFFAGRWLWRRRRNRS